MLKTDAKATHPECSPHLLGLEGACKHLTRGMWPAMVAQGYKENTKVLTRAQVRTIVQFLGEP